MAFCRYCGKELINGACDCQANQEPVKKVEKKNKEPFIIPSFHFNFSSLSGFISSLRDLSGLSEPVTSGKDPFERNIPIVPDCVQAEEDEVVVKQYHIAKLRTRLKFMKAEGRMMVTNKRVLFRAAGTSLTGNIAQDHQFALDEIAGVEIHKDFKFSFLNFFASLFVYFLAIACFVALFANSNSNGGAIAIGVILGIVGMVPTFILYKRFWLKLFCAIVGSACFSLAYTISDQSGFLAFLTILANVIVLMDLIIVCFLPNVVIKIKTKSAWSAIEIGSQKSIFERKTGDDYCGFAEVMPGDDIVLAMNELGTIISDLQKNGTCAVEKWSK